METRREKTIKRNIELLFDGMEQDDLKAVILAISLNKSEEERDRIAEEIRIAKEKDLAEFMTSFEMETIEPQHTTYGPDNLPIQTTIQKTQDILYSS